MSRFITLSFTFKRNPWDYKKKPPKLSKVSSTLHVHKTSKIKDEFEHVMAQSTASLDNLYQGLKTLTEKIFFPISKLNLPFSV